LKFPEYLFLTKNNKRLQQISIDIIDHQIEAINGFPQPINHSPHTNFILDAFTSEPGIHRFLDVFLMMGFRIRWDSWNLGGFGLVEFYLCDSKVVCPSVHRTFSDQVIVMLC
jgi:hypothetical protein